MTREEIESAPIGSIVLNTDKDKIVMLKIDKDNMLYDYDCKNISIKILVDSWFLSLTYELIPLSPGNKSKILSLLDGKYAQFKSLISVLGNSNKISSSCRVCRKEI